MRVIIREQIAELWVPRGTPESEVQAACAEQQAQGREVVIYRSGAGSLPELTAALLRANAQ